MLGVLVALTLLVSCATMDKQAAGVVMIVDRAMQAWAGYVREAKATGSVPAETLAKQEGEVRTIYGAYQRSMISYDELRTLNDPSLAKDSLDEAEMFAAALSKFIEEVTR